MTEILITAGVGLVSTITSSIVTWLLARRKYNTEVDNNLIENMQKSLEFYKTLSNDNKERLEEALKRADRLEEEVAKMRQDMFNLMSQICINFSCTMRQQGTPLFKGAPVQSNKTKKNEKNPS